MILAPGFLSKLTGKHRKSTVLVRTATERDVPILDRDIPSEYGRSHRDDLHAQGDGLLTFNTAWWDGKLAGTGFVMWGGPRRTSVYERYPLCPEICRLGVKREYRSQGIGTLMIRACEEEAIARGFDIIGLGVSVDNLRAATFYAGLGYRQSTVTRYVDEYQLENSDGEVVTAREIARFLIKFLA